MKHHLRSISAKAALLAAETAGHAQRKEITWLKIAFSFLFVVVMLTAGAEHAYAADAGTGLAQGFRNLFYGSWGFVIGVIIFAAAVYAWLRVGVGAALLIAVVGVVFFLIPSIVDTAQSYGRSQSQSVSSSAR